ncbi:UDP-N-acetylglucosamine 4,6-dehydratase [Seleniivibrio woodruffii]|uniref:Polysaccharide biosynthesis protein n=1 Tax=Seleniivibrio woodruffii TaxID=1078050 RepID=A0A4R1KE12_9BACT|nr:UDP-N-acetylglucosamine 4,6-dehydratase [Seleniivibrio woodruffii]TCK62347.1 polysaccharide biosynthesis protein [Seleniivibrio woodruffii]TVZ34536.1 polysaccharide biosynthesis protein [Seleniivibrio woodruffii]
MSEQILELIGRKEELFTDDISRFENELQEIVANSTFLVIGGAGSIGQAVVKEIFKRNPLKLHVVDISENNLAELVRDIRSSFGYINGDFRTFALDAGAAEYDAFIRSDGKYDYVLNLSALKHVRSEKDPYTLMRLIRTNVSNTEKTVMDSVNNGSKKYFCVSTDKAANPVNMMGASKRIMEMFLMRLSTEIPISTARFANVAFSDGSLMFAFNQRIQKRQPIAAPNDIKRYFVTPKESGELCLMSCLLGENRDIFFPKLSEKLHLITFAEIAVKYLSMIGYEPYLCSTEEEARSKVLELIDKKKWPCLFTTSDTSGEKDFEEFYTDNEILDMERFNNLGIIKNDCIYDEAVIDNFRNSINSMLARGSWTKREIVDLFNKTIPEFKHIETEKYLDGKM